MAIKQCTPLIPINLECFSTLVSWSGVQACIQKFKINYNGRSLWQLQNISNGVFLCVCLDAYLISHGLVFELMPFSHANKHCLAIQVLLNGSEYE